MNLFGCRKQNRKQCLRECQHSVMLVEFASSSRWIWDTDFLQYPLQSSRDKKSRRCICHPALLICCQIPCVPIWLFNTVESGTFVDYSYVYIYIKLPCACDMHSKLNTFRTLSMAMDIHKRKRWQLLLIKVCTGHPLGGGIGPKFLTT